MSAQSPWEVTINELKKCCIKFKVGCCLTKINIPFPFTVYSRDFEKILIIIFPWNLIDDILVRYTAEYSIEYTRRIIEHLFENELTKQKLFKEVSKLRYTIALPITTYITVNVVSFLDLLKKFINIEKDIIIYKPFGIKIPIYKVFVYDICWLFVGLPPYKGTCNWEGFIFAHEKSIEDILRRFVKDSFSDLLLTHIQMIKDRMDLRELIWNLKEVYIYLMEADFVTLFKWMFIPFCEKVVCKEKVIDKILERIPSKVDREVFYQIYIFGEKLLNCEDPFYIISDIIKYVHDRFPMRRNVEKQIYENIGKLSLMNVIEIGPFKKGTVKTDLRYIFCGLRIYPK